MFDIYKSLLKFLSLCLRIELLFFKVGLWRYGIFSYRGEAATNIAVWRLIARTPKSLPPPPPSCRKSLMTFDQELMQLRLVVIDGVGGDTGVKSQHLLGHLPTAAPSPTIVFFNFFFIVIQII